MPKQIHKIDQFHGGLSTNSDPRDIADNEVSKSQNVNLTDLGKIRLLGEIDDNSSNINNLQNVDAKSGKGLFNYSVDTSNFLTPSGPVSNHITSAVHTAGAAGTQASCEIIYMLDGPESGTVNVDMFLYDNEGSNDTDFTSSAIDLTVNYANDNFSMMAIKGSTVFNSALEDAFHWSDTQHDFPDSGEQLGFKVFTDNKTDAYNGYKYRYFHNGSTTNSFE